MEDTTRGTPPLPPRVRHALRLAEIIREVYGSLNVGDLPGSVLGLDQSVTALAEAFLAHPGFSRCHDGPAALPAQEQGEVEPSGAMQRLLVAPIDVRGYVDLRHTTTPPPLPPGYIDSEHQGEDRELLEAFYGATNAEGGTADEIHLRGIRAVLALRPTVAAVRAADAAIADEAIEAEFRAWWRANVHPVNPPRYHAVTTHIAWARHILSRGEP